MKTNILICLLALPFSLFSQGFSVDFSVPADTMIYDFFQNDSVTISNVNIIANGLDIAFFDRGDSDFPIGAGIVLSTGDASTIPNYAAEFISSNLGLPGDSDIESITGITSYDAVTIEFDFVPSDDQLLDFKYIFGSEEYPEFVGSIFNDAFLFLISGPGINGTYSNNAMNTAMIPNEDIPVTINNVNHQSYTNYYIDNEQGDVIAFDGHTTLLPANFMVQQGSMYHAKIVISDVGDGVFDSGIFLGYNSLGNIDSLIPPTQASLVVENGVLFVENESKYATEYQWDFGNGVTSTEKHPGYVEYTEPGTYIVQLHTSNYCCSNSFSQTIEIQNVNLTLAVDVINNVSCFGEADGTATINTFGGSGEYTTTFNPDIANLNAIPAGTYDVTVDDGISEITQTFTITEPEELLSSENVTNEDAGMNNGSILVTVEGGVEPYAILWSNGSTDFLLENISADTYSYEIVDGAGCITTGEVEVSTIYLPLSATETVLNNVSCFGGTDGSVLIISQGGLPPYDINFIPEIIDMNNVPSNNYTYQVTSADGQFYESSFIITEPLELLAEETVQDSDFGQANGSITIEIDGGTAPYSILWSNNETTETIENLPPATYSVEVKDANDCIWTGTFEVGTIVANKDIEFGDFGLNPNPASQYIQLSDVPTAITKAKIIAMDGQQWKVTQQINNETKINVSHLHNGLYILQLEDKNGKIHRTKFIKL